MSKLKVLVFKRVFHKKSIKSEVRLSGFGGAFPFYNNNNNNGEDDNDEDDNVVNNDTFVNREMRMTITEGERHIKVLMAVGGSNKRGLRVESNKY